MSRRSYDDPHGETVEARQGLLDNRCEKAPKKHRVKGRRVRRTAAKKRSIARKVELVNANRRRFQEKALAYWRGERDDHP